jgi:hypothetical protein
LAERRSTSSRALPSVSNSVIGPKRFVEFS